MKFLSRFSIDAVQNKVRMRVFAVAMRSGYHLKAVELFRFRNESQSNFVSNLRRNALVFWEGLNEMIILSAVILAV